MRNMQLPNDWSEVLKEQTKAAYFIELEQRIKVKYTSELVYPPENEIFNAFELCSFANTKVVVLGQDPYHGIGQAHGLSFSVRMGVPFPPSLRNIFKELKQDLSVQVPFSGDLSPWAKQGVLLMNATLTVKAGTAGAHQGLGWETFTDSVMERLSEEKENLVFLLWGSFAQKKEALIDTSKHLVLKSAHPSPLSAYRGFFGNKHFSKTNEYLAQVGLPTIKW